MQIIDGQNETQILHYIQSNNINNWDPCIPTKFNIEHSIKITFNSTNIQDFNDWHPSTLCNKQNAQNQYLFDGAHTFVFNNLIVNNYIITNAYPSLIRSGDYFNASISCNKCIFDEITLGGLFSAHQLIVTFGSIYMMNCKLNNINTGIWDVILADRNTGALVEFHRHFLFHTVLLFNISAGSFLYSMPWNNDYYGNLLSIKDCNIAGISGTAFIYDSTRRCNVEMYNVVFHILSGSIYHSFHQLESQINMENISIHTATLAANNQETGLLFFAPLDMTNITLLNLRYKYNTVTNCELSYSDESVVINATCDHYRCSSPMTAIRNFGGKMALNDIDIDMDILYVANTKTNNSHFIQYGYDDTSGVNLIENQGSMIIKNMYIKQAMCRQFLASNDLLSIYNLSFASSFMEKYNPNDLHPYFFLYQIGPTASLLIENSHFFGSHTQLDISSGIAEIYSSVFQHGFVAIQANSLHQFILKDCTIKNNGRFYGQFSNDQSAVGRSMGMQLDESNNMLLFNNTISGFDLYGLLLFDKSSNIIMEENTFNVDIDELYYDISTQDLKLLLAVITCFECSDSATINNEFLQNHVYPSEPWIDYRRNSGTTCLSGNVFINYAIYSIETDITSCFRLDLVNCLYNFSDQCSKGIYGSLNPVLFDDIGYFNVNESEFHDPIIVERYGAIALDNINIRVIEYAITNTHNPIILDSVGGKICLIDSYITKYDISYYSNCAIMFNDRLSSNLQYISHLSMNCSSSLIDNDLNKSMDSSKTEYVNHLSTVQVFLSVNSSSYYPGDLLELDYCITDKIGNILMDNASDGFVINLHSNTYSTDIEIYQDGLCPLCDLGLLINVISIKDDIGDVFEIDVSIVDDQYYMKDSQIYLDIVGCPIMYGPEANNFTCIPCNTDYFSLQRNNIQYCKSCDLVDNPNLMFRDIKHWFVKGE